MPLITINKTIVLRVIALVLGLASLQLTYGSEIQDDEHNTFPSSKMETEPKLRGHTIEEKEKEHVNRAKELIAERELLQKEINQLKPNTPGDILVKGFLMIGVTGVCDKLFTYMGLPSYSCFIVPFLICYYCAPEIIRNIKKTNDLNKKISVSNAKTNKLRVEVDFLRSVKEGFGERSEQNNCDGTEKAS